jgi:hypothetical protein
VSLAVLTLCIASQRVFIVVIVVVYFVMTQSGNLWRQPRISARTPIRKGNSSPLLLNVRTVGPMVPEPLFREKNFRSKNVSRFSETKANKSCKYVAQNKAVFVS